VTDPVDLLTRAAQKLCDITDEAVDAFEAEHGEGQDHAWSPVMGNLLGGPVGAYTAVVGNPTIGYALVDQLRKTAADAAVHIPAWNAAHDRRLGVWQRRREEGINVDAERPAPVGALVEDHYGPMLAVARAVLGEPLELRNVTAEGLPTGNH
jgi:hypothetical protein